MAEDAEAFLAMLGEGGSGGQTGGKKNRKKKKKGGQAVQPPPTPDASAPAESSAPTTTAAVPEASAAVAPPAPSTDAADAFLASLDGGDAGGGGKKKKKKKKKGNQATGGDEAEAAGGDADGGEDAGEAAAAAPAPAPASAAPTDAEAFLASLGDPEVPSEGKKKKKKNKKKDKTAEASPAAAEETGGKKGKKGKGGKSSAAAKLILQRQEKARLEAERLAAEEAELRKKEEEEERKRQEEEAARQAILDAKRERAKKKKEAARAAGTYKTKAQRQKEAAAAERLKQMQAAGLIVAGLDNDSGSGKRPQYGKKRNKGKGKGKGKDVKKDVPPKEPAVQEAEAEATGSGAGAGTGSGPEETPEEEAPEEEETWGSWEDAAGVSDELLDVKLAAVKGGEEDVTLRETMEASLALAAAAAAGGGSESTSGGAGSGRLTLEERIDESRARRRAREEEAEKSLSADRLRSPICCVLGHVDTGKTKLLDRIRRTNVQDGEAGGITQQIGATYFPMDRIRRQTDKLNKELQLEYRVPGLLMIDTPGHESFTNLRTRGSSLCDIAVLVVDLMHGLEPQTIESLNLLRRRRTPFIVALNKIDRVYGWKPQENSPVRASLAEQEDYAVTEFEDRTSGVMTQLMEQGLNSKLYYENSDFKRIVSVVPTSAMTGEGIPDLLMLLVQLTQQLMSRKLMYSPVVACTVLEVKAVEGLGTTIDVVLVNGELKEGDTIVVCGLQGPIVTNVRALLTPQPMREIRVKSEYVHHKRIEAAMGIKIAAHNLDKAVAGTSLLVSHPDDEIEDLKEEVMEDLQAVMGSLAKESRGVFVQASTLGSLEALMEYLRSREPPVPVAGVNIGPIHKKDVVIASTMLEHKKEYATILAFDVKVTSDARAAAEELGVTIFTADIIYHLTDQFDEYLGNIKRRRQEASAASAVFPCVLRIVPAGLFNKKSPLVLGVDVVDGTLRIGTPLCVVAPASDAPEAKVDSDDEESGPRIVQLGRVTSIERNHESVDAVKPGGPSVAIKVEHDSPVVYGRHFTLEQPLYSRITRGSIDVLKEDFREDLSKSEWRLVVNLKKALGIP